MSILLDERTRVLVQGITGWTARRHLEYMLDYGTRVVAGVSPGRGGSTVRGIPVYDSVAEAAAGSGPIDLSLLFVTPPAVRDAALEAIAGAVPVVLVTAEGVPYRDTIEVVHAAAAAGTLLIGPNAQGMISPGRAKIGATGGDDPERIFSRGSVGVISRSGGMGSETSWLLSRNGIGQSTYVAIGGELINGAGFTDVAALFEQDGETEVLVCFGEPGGVREEQLAEAVAAGRITKPVVAYVVGSFLESAPEGVSFGHVGAVVRDGKGAPSAKRAVLRDAGVRVADRWSDIPVLVSEALRERSGDEADRDNEEGRADG